MITAKEKLERLEKDIFKGIVKKLSDNSQFILNLARVISEIDVFQSFAWIAFQEGFISPIIQDKKILQINGGWHPLIKSQLKEEFVAHDLTLNSNQYFGLEREFFKNAKILDAGCGDTGKLLIALNSL